MAKVLLFGLESSIADELKSVLEQLRQTVQIALPADTILEQSEANVVFTAGQNLASIREKRPELPVVVVSRLPEVREWLDALEHGAIDYCGAPFEPSQVRWVLDSSLGALAGTRIAA